MYLGVVTKYIFHHSHGPIGFEQNIMQLHKEKKGVAIKNLHTPVGKYTLKSGQPEIPYFWKFSMVF